MDVLREVLRGREEEGGGGTRERERDPSIYTLVAKGAATTALYKVFPRLAVVRSQARDHNAFLYLSTCMIYI